MKPTLAEGMAARTGFPAWAVEKLLDHESELDQIWPDWRMKKPFDAVRYDLKARIKWLLKKVALLTNTEGGLPAPRDWDVMIEPDLKNKSKCYAHPVLPVNDAVREATREPPSPLARQAVASAPVVQIEQAGPETAPLDPFAVEAMACKPATWLGTDDEWIGRYWIEQEAARAKVPITTVETMIADKESEP